MFDDLAGEVQPFFAFVEDDAVRGYNDGIGFYQFGVGVGEQFYVPGIIIFGGDGFDHFF